MAKVTVLLNHVRDIDFDVEINGEIQHLVCNGSGHHLKGKTQGILPEQGVGITFDVDADLWNAVAKKYAKMAIFANGLIRATKSAAETETVKADLSTVENGDEPVNPDKPKRKRMKK